MRILQVFNQYINRGGEEVWVEKLPELSADDHEWSELRFRSSDWTGDGAPSRLQQARWLGDNPDSRRRLRESVADFRPDVLLFHNLIPVASLGLYDEAKRIGIPVVQYIHNFRPFSPSGRLWVNDRPEEAALRGNPWPEIFGGAWNDSRLKTGVVAWHLHRLRNSGALDAVRGWIAISDAMRDAFEQAGIPGRRLTTLRHCWETSEHLEATAEGDYYLFIGALYPYKGIDVLLKAWRLLEEELGGQCPKLVIGGKGSLEGEVRTASERSDRIEYLEFVEGAFKQQLVAGCRALLVPSVWAEPLGLVVYEAYENRRPVISSGSGGLAETVDDGRTGILHLNDDPASLTSAVKRMEAAGPAGREAMGASGREWLEHSASPEDWRRSFDEMLRTAVS
ncbi:MAG: glycosyltransferase [Verrucomicrobiota bacterium]